jgi:hypothetical protein
MCEPRPLTTLWASTACYRDSFTFFFIKVHHIIQRFQPDMFRPFRLSSGALRFEHSYSLCKLLDTRQCQAVRFHRILHWSTNEVDTLLTPSTIQSVRMKGIQNKKMYFSENNCRTRIRFMSTERKTLNIFSCPAYAHAPAGDLRRAQ